MSRSQPIMRTLNRIDAAFPSGSVPATTVIKAEDVTAPVKDFLDTMKANLPIVFGFVLSFAFVLLLVTFPLDRGAPEGDRAQPAVGRCGLRHPHP